VRARAVNPTGTICYNDATFTPSPRARARAYAGLARCGAIVGILLFRFLHTSCAAVKSLFEIIPRTITRPRLSCRPPRRLSLARPFLVPFLPCEQRQIKLNVTQLFSVCAAPDDSSRYDGSLSLSLLLSRSLFLPVPLRSLAVAARVYHRAYKSAREDQIGFQKYKIHTAILKNKSEAASARETKERTPGEKER